MAATTEELDARTTIPLAEHDRFVTDASTTICGAMEREFKLRLAGEELKRVLCMETRATSREKFMAVAAWELACL